MKCILKYFVSILFSILVIGCGDSKREKKAPLLKVRAPLNQIIVIASEKTWNTGFKTFMLDSLIQSRKGMFFSEPEFSVRQFSTLATAKSYKKFPNYIILKKGKENIKFEEDVLAQGQTVVTISGETLQSIEKTLISNKTTIFKKFHQNDEKMWLSHHIGKYHDAYPELDKMGVFFRIPLSYRKVQREKDFVHYQYDVSDKTRIRSANLTVIRKPYGLDSIDLEDIISLRDLIGRKHIKSSEENSYMETHRLLDDYLYCEVIKDSPEERVYKTSGMWSMKHDIKGGAFVNYVIIDKNRDQLFMFDGFTFVSSSGNTNTSSIFYRRDLLTELEFIFGSYKILEKQTSKE
ncbi:MAG: DUF4837 family protein [Flavobacteriales bacterium]